MALPYTTVSNFCDVLFAAHLPVPKQEGGPALCLWASPVSNAIACVMYDKHRSANPLSLPHAFQQAADSHKNRAKLARRGYERLWYNYPTPESLDQRHGSRTLEAGGTDIPAR